MTSSPPPMTAALYGAAVSNAQHSEPDPTIARGDFPALVAQASRTSGVEPIGACSAGAAPKGGPGARARRASAGSSKAQSQDLDTSQLPCSFGSLLAKPSC